MKNELDDSLLDPLAQEVFGGSSIKQSLGNFGCLDSTLESVPVTVPAPAPAYTGNTAAELAKSRLLEHLTGMDEQELRRLAPRRSWQATLSKLKANPLWQKLVKIAIKNVTEDESPLPVCQLVCVVEAGRFDLAQTVLSRLRR